MSETESVIISVLILITAYIVLKQITTWKMKRAYSFIIEDLVRLGAINCSSAARLPYAKMNVLRIGMRDYRFKCLEYMILFGVIGKTENEEFYLRNRNCTAPDI